MEQKYIHITAAKGPIQCELAAAKILPLFLRAMENLKVNSTVIHHQQGAGNGQLKSATIVVSGENLSEKLVEWLGVIRWIETEKSSHSVKKRKNWHIGILELNEGKMHSFNEKEVQLQAIRSSGPGGQHVNKVSTAIRATHLPSGISVVAQDGRSQVQNKKNALIRLHEKVVAKEQAALISQDEQIWASLNSVRSTTPIRQFQGTLIPDKKKEKSFKSNRQHLKRELNKHLKNDE